MTWYTTLIVDQVVRPVKEAFEKEYPFIQMEYFRGNTERIVQKMSGRIPSQKIRSRYHRRHGFADHGAAREFFAAIFIRRSSPNIRQN